MDTKDNFSKADFEQKKRELQEQLRRHEHAKQKAELAASETQRKLESLTIAWEVLHGSNGNVSVQNRNEAGLSTSDQIRLDSLSNEFTSSQFRSVSGMSRGATFNALIRLEKLGKISLIKKGGGKTPSIYRKL